MKTGLGVFLAALLATGCGNVSRVVITPLGDPVLLIESVEGPLEVLVAVDGKWVEGVVDEIPACFACLAPEKDDFQ